MCVLVPVPPSPLCGPCTGGPEPDLPGADGSGKKKKKSKRGSKEDKRAKKSKSKSKLAKGESQSGWSAESDK